VEAVKAKGKEADADELKLVADVEGRLKKHEAALGWVEEVIEADEAYRKAQYDYEQLKKESGIISRQIGAIMKGVKKGTNKKEEADALMEKNKSIKSEIPQVEAKSKALVAKRDKTMHLIGNLIHRHLPVHHDEDFNVHRHEFDLDKRRNTAESPEEGILSHVELFQLFEGSDLESGSKVAGSRGYYLKGHAVMLNQALINYGLCFLSRLGYVQHQCPFFMKKEMMAMCAQLEQFDEELYKVVESPDKPETDKYLIATSEQPMCAMHAKMWMKSKDLPKRLAGYSTCFRKEAGSHGRDTMGVFRIHQFEKVEQFVITSPEMVGSKAVLHVTCPEGLKEGDTFMVAEPEGEAEVMVPAGIKEGESFDVEVEPEEASWREFRQMSKISQQFYESLGLPFVVVDIVSGELNNAAARKHDLEAWFPAARTYRELVSCSNCLDYQSRRLDCRLMGSQGGVDSREAKFVHMLNSTLCATERAMCCIVENYQTKNGIRVPEVLVPFMVGVDLLPFTKTLEEVMPKPVEKKGKKGKKKGK